MVLDLSALDQCIEENVEEDGWTIYDFAHFEVLNENLCDVINWACLKLSNMRNGHEEKAFKIAKTFMESLPFSYDPDICLLLLTGQANLFDFMFIFEHLLDPIKHCISAVKVLRFRRIIPLLETLLLNSVHACEPMSDFDRYDSLSVLFTVMNSLVSLYEMLILGDHFSCFQNHEHRILCKHILFMFGRTLIFLSAPKCGDLCLRMIMLLFRVTPCFYEFFNECLMSMNKVNNNGTEFTIQLLAPAWLRILFYIIVECDHYETSVCWPSVLSERYQIGLLCDVIKCCEASIINHCISSNSAHKDHLSDTISEPFSAFLESRAVEFLEKILNKSKCTLNSSWWCSERLSLIDFLHKLATKPVSSDILPHIVVQTLECTKRLFSMSTHSSQYILYCYTLGPKFESIHHGWRGHMITLCKNCMHDLWIQTSKVEMDKLCDIERNNMEVDINFIVQHNCFYEVCRLIFHYPSSSEDNLLDQSSWILAALNMALYIVLRSEHIDVASGIFSNFIGETNDPQNLHNRFILPLESQVNCSVDELSSKIYVLERSLELSDSSQRTTLKAELRVLNSSMLRLRLLKLTLEHVQREIEANLKHKK